MTQIAGKSFTELTNLNIGDELRVGGQLIAGAEGDVSSIHSLADLLDAAAAVNDKVIFLKAGREYRIFGRIDLEDYNIVGVNGASLIGLDNTLDGFTSTAAITIFFNGAGDFLIDGIFIENYRETGAQLVMFSNAGASAITDITMVRVRLTIESGQTVLSFGTCEDLASLEMTDCVLEMGAAGGPLTFKGNTINPVFNFHSNTLVNSSGGTSGITFIELDNTTSFVFKKAHISSNTLTGSGEAIAGTADVSYMSASEIGIISDNDFGGTVAPVSNIAIDVNNVDGETEKSSWLSHKNIGLIDTRDYLEAVSLSTTTGETLNVVTFTRLAQVFKAIKSSYGFAPRDVTAGPNQSSFSFLSKAANQEAVYFVEFRADATTSVSASVTLGIAYNGANASNVTPFALTTSAAPVYANAFVTVKTSELLGIGALSDTAGSITFDNVSFTARRVA